MGSGRASGQATLENGPVPTENPIQCCADRRRSGYGFAAPTGSCSSGSIAGVLVGLVAAVAILLSLPLWGEGVGPYQYPGAEIVIRMVFALGFNLPLGYTGLPTFVYTAMIRHVMDNPAFRGELYGRPERQGGNHSGRARIMRWPRQFSMKGSEISPDSARRGSFCEPFAKTFCNSFANALQYP